MRDKKREGESASNYKSKSHHCSLLAKVYKIKQKSEGRFGGPTQVFTPMGQTIQIQQCQLEHMIMGCKRHLGHSAHLYYKDSCDMGLCGRSLHTFSQWCGGHDLRYSRDRRVILHKDLCLTEKGNFLYKNVGSH